MGGRGSSSGKTSTRTMNKDYISEDAFTQLSSFQNYTHDSDYAKLEPNGDGTLKAIYKDLGYDGKPKLVDEAALDSAISSGDIEMYRGIAGHQAGQYINDFKTGDYFAGLGIYGNGTYAAIGPKMGKSTAASYAGGKENVMRMALHKSAKVVDYDSILKDYQQYSDNMYDKHKKATTKAEKAEILRQLQFAGELGRFAALRGYDAIRKNFYTSGPHDGDYMVVLNRSKLIVQK